MKPHEIVARRMSAQRLRGPGFASAEDAVTTLAAMQSQEYAYAKWSIAQRTKRLTDDDVERAFNDGMILRTHILRPTWHFVTASDIRWMLALTGPRVQKAVAHAYRREELDAATLAKSESVIEKALGGGEHLTRAALGKALNGARLDAYKQRLAYMVLNAELEAIVCSGRLSGKKHTYALLDERVPRARAMAREDALAELTRRYFTTRGPATVKDMSWWSGLTMADCRAGIEMAGSELERLNVDERAYWYVPSRRPAPRKTTVDLVQVYDEYLVAYSESRDVISPKPSELLTRTVFGMHVVLADGKLAGRWARRVGKGTTTLEVALHRRLDKSALDAAVDRFRRYQDLPVEVSVVST